MGYLIMVFLGLNIGIKGSKRVVNPMKFSDKINFSKIINFLTLISIALSLMSLSQKLKTYGLGYSLSAFTQLRYAQIHEHVEKGQGVLGPIANLISGFPIIFLLGRIYIRKFDWFFKAVLTLVILIAVSRGGRNSIMIISVLMFFGAKLFKNKISKTKILILGGSVLFFFILINAIRHSLSEGVTTSLAYVISDYEINNGIKIDSTLSNFIQISNSNLMFYIVELYYYLVHSIKEFDVLVINENINNFPYYGGYQLYSWVLGLNKLGFDFITIDQILSEIPNPGKYLTLIGAMYLDFGYMLMFIVLLIGYKTSKYYKKFKIKQDFRTGLNLICCLVILLFAPFYSVIGNGVFSAFFTNCIIYNLMFFFLKRDRWNII
ncbi:O-antigen polymerase [Tenacibaculum sp. 190524A02b]